jgi:succinyl-CoA synthetase beta subunit
VPQLQSALKQITEAKGIKVILVNILASASASEQVAQVIANYLLSKFGEVPVVKAVEQPERPMRMTAPTHRTQNNGTHTLSKQSVALSQIPHFVIRIVGGQIDSAKEHLAAIPIHWRDNLDEAVAQAIPWPTPR